MPKKSWKIARRLMVVALLIAGCLTEVKAQEPTKNAKLITKTFEVPLNFLKLVERPPVLPDPFGSDGTLVEDRGFMSQYGVTLEGNSIALFNPENGLLKVTNTAEQLDLIEKVVATFPKLTEAEEKALVSSIISEPIPNSETKLEESPAMRAIAEKLNRISFPNLVFRETEFRDALQFLQQKSVELDIREPDLNRRGVNIIQDGPYIGDPPPPITLSLTNVSMAKALKQITHQAGYQFWVKDYCVLIGPAGVPKPAIKKSIKYTIPDAIYKKMISLSTLSDPFAPDPEINNGLISVQSAIENAGVTFPFGCRARYNEKTGELFITNTQWGIDMIEVFLSSLDDGKMIFERNSRFHQGKSIAE